jgi:hypothetical protein
MPWGLCTNGKAAFDYSKQHGGNAPFLKSRFYFYWMLLMLCQKRNLILRKKYIINPSQRCLDFNIKSTQVWGIFYRVKNDVFSILDQPTNQ